MRLHVYHQDRKVDWPFCSRTGGYYFPTSPASYDITTTKPLQMKTSPIQARITGRATSAPLPEPLTMLMIDDSYIYSFMVIGVHGR